MRLALASRSSARRTMLEAAGVPFDSVEALADEEEEAKARLNDLPADQLATALAEVKALAAIAAPDTLVLGADQTLELDDGSILSKPKSREEAAEQLRAMSGNRHRLHSAGAIAEGNKIVWHAIESVRLQVRVLSNDFIERYLDLEYEQIRWSVGGYRIEGPGLQLFKRIEGSHFAILGLPLLPLLDYLRERGILPS